MRREGKRIRTEHLEVRALASLLSQPALPAEPARPAHPAHPRIGFVVPRYKHTAVDRNRLKRRLREIARTRLLPALPAGDVVIKALPHAYAADFDALGRQLERVVDRIAQATREPRRQATPATDASADASAAASAAAPVRRRGRGSAAGDVPPSTT